MFAPRLAKKLGGAAADDVVADPLAVGAVGVVEVAVAFGLPKFEKKLGARKEGRFSTLRHAM